MALHLSKVEVLAHQPFVDVLDVIAGRFEVGGGVVRTGQEDLAVLSEVGGLVQVADAGELLVYGLEQIQRRPHLLRRIARLHCGAGYGYVFTL